jgi:hypothetical protein
LIEISLSKEEFQLLTLIDGKRTLYEVCTTGPFGVSENARLIYAFRVLQLIELYADDENSTSIIKIQLRSE